MVFLPTLPWLDNLPESASFTTPSASQTAYTDTGRMHNSADVRGPAVHVHVNMPQLGLVVHTYTFRVHDMAQWLDRWEVDSAKIVGSHLLRNAEVICYEMMAVTLWSICVFFLTARQHMMAVTLWSICVFFLIGRLLSSYLFRTFLGTKLHAAALWSRCFLLEIISTVSFV